MKISLISFTSRGYRLLNKLLDMISDTNEARGYYKGKYLPADHETDSRIEMVTDELSEWVRTQYAQRDAIVFISSAGIAVRSIAPFVKDKYRDPAVVVMDEYGKNIISLLSGHLGGANELTNYLADKLQGNPVITTATDLNDVFAVDLFVKKNQLLITDRELAKEISAVILNDKKVFLHADTIIKGDWPEELANRKETSEQFGIYVSPFVTVNAPEIEGKSLHLIPKVISIGIGCKKSTSEDNLKQFILEQLERKGIDIRSVINIASIDIKREEECLLRISRELEVPFLTYGSEELMKAEGEYERSDYVSRITGVDNVCERAAKLASNHGKIILHKTKGNGMTLALAMKEWSVTL